MGKITERPRIAAIKGEMLKLAMRELVAALRTKDAQTTCAQVMHRA